MKTPLRVFGMAGALLFAAIPYADAAWADDSATAESDRAAAFTLSGVSRFSIDSGTSLRSFVGGTATIAPRLSAALGNITLALEPRFEVDADTGSRASLDEASARTVFGSFLVKAGRFSYTPGSATLFSNVNYFSPPDYVRLATGDDSSPTRADYLAQARYEIDGFSIGASFAPFRPESGVIPQESPWFPKKGVRTELYLIPTTYMLNATDWVDDTRSGSFKFDPAYSIEAGLAGDGWRFALSGFYGPDREPGTTSKITLLIASNDEFDVAISPIRSRIARLGAAGKINFGFMDAWIDASAFRGKRLETGNLYSTADGLATSSATADGIDYTVGFFRGLPVLGSSISAEWRNTWYVDPKEGSTLPFLHRAIAWKAVLPLFNGPGMAAIRFTAEVSGIYSLEDGSATTVPALSADLGNDKALVIRYLRLWGSSDTELGQFADSSRVEFIFTTRL
jgi:hypothetical protein